MWLVTNRDISDIMWIAWNECCQASHIASNRIWHLRSVLGYILFYNPHQTRRMITKFYWRITSVDRDAHRRRGYDTVWWERKRCKYGNHLYRAKRKMVMVMVKIWPVVFEQVWRTVSVLLRVTPCIFPPFSLLLVAHYIIGPSRSGNVAINTTYVCAHMPFFPQKV